MKLFKKLAAAALVGVMALSMLTGCAVGDAMKENAMLTAMQTLGNRYQVDVSESDSLSKKASGVFSAFKAAEGTAWDTEELTDDIYYNAIYTDVTYKEVTYRVMVIKMPKNAKDSTKWANPADFILDGLGGCVEWDEENNGKLKVGFDVMNNAKITSTQEKSEDYMIVFAKAPARV